MSAGPSGRVKHCLVVYATRGRQYLWPVELDAAASVQDALEAARALAGAEPLAIAWQEAEVGIFGEPVSRSRIPADGDRVEVYRQLASDPKQARRARARRERERGRRGGHEGGRRSLT